MTGIRPTTAQQIYQPTKDQFIHVAVIRGTELKESLRPIDSVLQLLIVSVSENAAI